jgi:hypothetical protein
MFFRFSNHFGQHGFHSLGRYTIHVLFFAALALALLGVLVLLFPVVLAVFVAAIFFWIAAMCLGFAWKIFRASRPPSAGRRRIDVDIIDPDGRP